MTDEIDPITLEVLWSRFRGIPREMGTHLSRTAFSAVIKYARDYSTGVFTPDGRLISQGVYAPGHLGSMPFMVRKLLDGPFPPERWEPGDIVLTNDPYINAGHLPDLFYFRPVFADGELAAFCVIGGHQLDIGGAGNASYTMYVTDMYAEGIQIPPIKLYENDDLNEQVMDIITENSRESRKIAGDLRAQYGAIKTGCDLVEELIDEYDLETVHRYADEIIERSERRIRDAIAEVPDGSYSSEDKLDGFEEPLPVHVEVTVDGDEITVDFAGTAAQLPERAVNTPRQYTFAYTMLTIKAMLDPDSPQTHGTVAPITLKAPEGSILNARPPVPVGSRQLNCERIIGTIQGALNQAIPERTPAPGGQPLRQMFKFTDPDTGTQQVLFDGHYGGAGAHPDRDGFPAVAGSNNLKNTPIEAIEAEYPLRFDRYQLEPDTGGAGRYRGGSGTVRDYHILQQADIQLVDERFEFGPPGLDRGEAGRPGGAVLNPDSEDARELSSKDRFKADPGDVLRIYAPGGGGYGDPSARDPERVREDVENGVVTPEHAHETYGIDPHESSQSSDSR